MMALYYIIVQCYCRQMYPKVCWLHVDSSGLVDMAVPGHYFFVEMVFVIFPTLQRDFSVQLQARGYTESHQEEKWAYTLQARNISMQREKRESHG